MDIFDNLYLCLFYIILISIGVFLLFLFHYLIYLDYALRKRNKFEDGKNNYKYAVLIPARDESKVIENCLISLKNQTYKNFDVYVIVESEQDETVNIVNKYGYNVIIRKNIDNRRTKGYALDDAYQEIKDLDYDAYMVFDADNILANDFIKVLNDCKNQGYQVVVGYRNFTNATYNYVTSGSALMFSMINNLSSYGRNYIYNKTTITGTGYYIDKKIVEDAGGWIWNGMTEDVELTSYCYYHNVKMYYVDYASYYDEQSENMKVAHKQHIRWVWGFLGNKKRFKEPKNIDYKATNKFLKFLSKFENFLTIFPIVELLVTSSAIAIASFIVLIVSFFFKLDSNYVLKYSLYSLSFILFSYLLYVLTAASILAVDNKRLKFKGIKKIKAVFTFAPFLVDFIFAFLDGLFHKKKRTTWDKINHSGDVISKKARKQLYGTDNKEKR